MKTNIMKINGEWDLGYVLDWHTLSSVYTGDNAQGHPTFDTTRSEVGEALYQLKYKLNLQRVAELADTFVANLKGIFKSASFVIPMPPSKKRVIQPLPLLAKNVAERLGIPIFDEILLKSGATAEMKNVGDREERIEALMKAFEINNQITNKGCWDVLLIDDIYDTDASLTAATRTLRTYKKVDKIFVGAFTRTGRP